jgi:hypothetical protein
MKRPLDARARTFALLLTTGLGLTACGIEDGGEAVADAGLETGGSGGEGAGGAAGLPTCTPPTGATVLLDWAVRDREQGSPVYNLTVDGEHLYVQQLDRIVRVPVAGGTEEVVFENRSEIPITTNAWVRTDDQLFVVDDQGPLLVPKAGGAVTPLSLPDDRWLGGLLGMNAPYDRATNTLYAAKFSSETGEQLTTLFSIGVDDALQTLLAEGLRMESSSNFDFDDGAVYAQLVNIEPRLQVTRDAGASWQTVEFTVAPETEARFAGAHAGQVWFTVANFSTGFTGLASAPNTGGELVLAAEDYILTTQLAKADGYVGMNNAGALFVAPTSGGGASREIPLAIGPDCTSHSVAVGAGRVFSSFFHASSGESLVFALPL